jgi:serine/threonine-protein kinase
MIPVAGQQVGPYEILGRLGSGGMGIVFSAWDSRLHRDVAIKLLREDYTRADDRERFLMEARAASGLNHPNICTIFDMGEQEGNPYMVMELLRGQTLRSCIQSGPMSTEEILHTGIEIADALVAAHTRGIIHRDIKPANIFLVDKPYGGWQVKVLDFGLAKIDLGDGVDPMLEVTAQGTTVGTVAYMSPEQARGETLDARSDLFAAGIVLYEMATGIVPFQGKTSATVFVELLNEPPQLVRNANPDIPIEFERIILKLLAKDRTERFQSSAELLDALHHVVLPDKPSAPNRRFGSPPPSTSAILRAFESDEKPQTSDSSSGGERPSSRETSIIRPVRREPLPPSEFPVTPTHWTRPSQLGGVATAGDLSSADASASSGSVSAECMAAIARTNQHPPEIFSFSEPEGQVAVPVPVVEESAVPRWLLWASAGIVVSLLVGILIWRIGAVRL